MAERALYQVDDDEDQGAGDFELAVLEGELSADDLPRTFHEPYPHCSTYAWWDAASCRTGELVQGVSDQARVTLFHPGRNSTKRAVALAKRICAGCPVQMECLDYAIEANENIGIWGGLGAKERRPLARARKVAKASLSVVDGEG